MVDEDSPSSNREDRSFSEYFKRLPGRSEMTVPFLKKPHYLALMKPEILALIAALLATPLAAQTKRQERRSLLDSDPEVVYLEQTLTKPVDLKVVKEAPVFSDKEGQHRLGTLKAGQTVRLEAITDKIYRVRGQGTRDGIAGWVAPWAFSSTDPEFVTNLKLLFERQIQVQALIAAHSVAVGMTLDEVALSRGKPTKSSIRKTGTGQSGRWEWVDYEEIKHYVNRIDPVTGSVFRVLSHVTQVEKSKTAVEFENDVVTAVEESEDRQGGNVRIVVPPLLFRW